MEKLTNIAYCTLYKKTDQREKVCDLPPNCILYFMGERVDGFTKVVYPASRDFIGWVEDVYLEPLRYITRTSVVQLDHPTASQQDLAQYVFVDRKVQYNLCGELCVCALADKCLSDMLSKWKAQPTSWYNRIFQNGMSRTTVVPDLLNMAQAYPELESQSLKELYALKGRIVITPTRLEDTLCFGWRIIIGVHIDYRGRLKKTGVLHWVTITNAVNNGFDGWITYYNPARLDAKHS